MQLDDGYGENGQGITNGVAVMRPRAGVEHHTCDVVLVRLVNPFAHLAFAVGLEGLHLDAQLFRERLQLAVNFVERDRSILLGIALAEHVVVDAMKHQERFHVDSINECRPRRLVRSWPPPRSHR